MRDDDNAFTPTPKVEEGVRGSRLLFVVRTKCTHLVFVFWSMVCVRANAIKLSQYKKYRFRFVFIFTASAADASAAAAAAASSFTCISSSLIAQSLQSMRCDAMRKRKYRELLRYSTHILIEYAWRPGVSPNRTVAILF